MIYRDGVSVVIEAGVHRSCGISKQIVNLSLDRPALYCHLLLFVEPFPIAIWMVVPLGLKNIFSVDQYPMGSSYLILGVRWIGRILYLRSE